MPERIALFAADDALAGRLEPDASEELQLAVRGQHLCRWQIPRETYPMDRAGYLKWRNDCKQMHAEKLGQILQGVGYDARDDWPRQSLVRKQRLKADPETQLLEDVACLVFLENYFAEFSREHDEAKLIDIVRKTWKKMSPRGHAAALQLPLSGECRRIVERAWPEVAIRQVDGRSIYNGRLNFIEWLAPLRQPPRLCD